MATVLEITFSGGSLRCPETPEYLEVALHLLQVLREQLRAGQPQTAMETPQGAPQPAPAPPPARVVPQHPAPSVPRPSRPAERVRWFVTHRPRIQVGPGQVVEPSTLEEVKEFLQSKGLTPHPRGDASMLLWQVRVQIGRAHV